MRPEPESVPSRRRTADDITVSNAVDVHLQLRRVSIGKTMSDPNPRRGNPAMVAGGPSLNPAGRPRRGQSLAEAVRAAVDPVEIAEMLLKIARDTEETTANRLQALNALTNRGWGAPAQSLDLNVSRGGDDLAERWATLTPAQRRAELDRLQFGTLALPAGDDS